MSARAAEAHQASVSYSQVQVGDDGAIAWTLRLSSRDLVEALGLDRDRDASDEEILAGQARLAAYAVARLRVRGDGVACPLMARDVAVLRQTDRFAELRLAARCAVPLRGLALESDLFFDLDRRHTMMLRVAHGDRTVSQELTAAARRFEWTLALGAPSLGALAYVKKGMEHIYTGADHIAFVVGLLLVAAVRRTSSSSSSKQDGGWEVRGLPRALPYALRIVTAFTVAHSLTLILAALDVIALPSRLVESAIAASIVYVAVENVWLGDPGHRWVLAFAFGLVHGLGFAAMLRPILPRTGVIAPLLEFNLGVELGQLTIVAPLLPVLHALAARRPRRYHVAVVLGGSTAVGMMGMVWLVMRVM